MSFIIIKDKIKVIPLLIKLIPVSVWVGVRFVCLLPLSDVLSDLYFIVNIINTRLNEHFAFECFFSIGNFFFLIFFFNFFIFALLLNEFLVSSLNAFLEIKTMTLILLTFKNKPCYDGIAVNRSDELNGL